MKEIKTLIESKIKNVIGIKKIKGEASTRNFFRIFRENGTLIAMVYPEKESAQPEIDKVVNQTAVYRKYLIPVPAIEEVIEGQIVIQEDLGDLLVQKVFYTPGIDDIGRILKKVADILLKLKEIPVSNTKAVLDTARMKWEMGFFLEHFASNYLVNAQSEEGRSELKERLFAMVDRVKPIETFAHRDFHSRNMLLHPVNMEVYMVDYQDSLVASLYYDLVSFMNDSYLELKSKKKVLLDYLREKGMVIDEDLMYITALERNIKALGTFGYQVIVRKNLSYKKYIVRTLRHVLGNPLFGTFFDPGIFKEMI